MAKEELCSMKKYEREKSSQERVDMVEEERIEQMSVESTTTVKRES